MDAGVNLVAFHILITKIAEEKSTAKYKFESNFQTGEFEINKENGEVTLTQGIPDDHKNKIFNRAAIKIMKEWKSGSLPDFSEWAS